MSLALNFPRAREATVSDHAARGVLAQRSYLAMLLFAALAFASLALSAWLVTHHDTRYIKIEDGHVSEIRDSVDASASDRRTIVSDFVYYLRTRLLPWRTNDFLCVTCQDGTATVDEISRLNRSIDDQGFVVTDLSVRSVIVSKDDPNAFQVDWIETRRTRGGHYNRYDVTGFFHLAYAKTVIRGDTNHDPLYINPWGAYVNNVIIGKELAL